MADIWISLRECLGTAQSESSSSAKLPALSRGQVQLQTVKQELIHLRMRRDMQLADIRSMLQKGTRRTDPRILAKARQLQRIDSQIASYELQESQLEDALHQESMSSIANETYKVLQAHSKKQKSRNYERELDMADEIHEKKSELDEHIDTLLSYDHGPDQNLEDFLTSVIGGVDEPNSNMPPSSGQVESLPSTPHNALILPTPTALPTEGAAKPENANSVDH